ncbi:MAG: hypothetical protein PUB53_05675 [Bacteroidales bacterium]|nr:hypothetical protein [Bacteroidales bacterium]
MAGNGNFRPFVQCLADKVHARFLQRDRQKGETFVPGSCLRKAQAQSCRQTDTVHLNEHSVHTMPHKAGIVCRGLEGMPAAKEGKVEVGTIKYE